jgi:hypothetical protein
MNTVPNTVDDGILSAMNSTIQTAASKNPGCSEYLPFRRQFQPAESLQQPQGQYRGVELDF